MRVLDRHASVGWYLFGSGLEGDPSTSLRMTSKALRMTGKGVNCTNVDSTECTTSVMSADRIITVMSTDRTITVMSTERSEWRDLQGVLRFSYTE